MTDREIRKLLPAVRPAHRQDLGGLISGSICALRARKITCEKHATDCLSVLVLLWFRALGTTECRRACRPGGEKSGRQPMSQCLQPDNSRRHWRWHWHLLVEGKTCQECLSRFIWLSLTMLHAIQSVVEKQRGRKCLASPDWRICGTVPYFLHPSSSVKEPREKDLR